MGGERDDAAKLNLVLGAIPDVAFAKAEKLAHGVRRTADQSWASGGRYPEGTVHDRSGIEVGIAQGPDIAVR